MTSKNKILIGVVVSVLLVLLVLNSIFSINLESFMGLFGVILGVLITELFHTQSAHEEMQHQLRMAALDRRLQAHQEAFSLWRRIMREMSIPENLSQVISDSQEWMNNNCLYLTTEARQAFTQAYMAATSHITTLRGKDLAMISYEIEIIRRAGEKIIQGVELPSIGEDLNNKQKIE